MSVVSLRALPERDPELQAMQPGGRRLRIASVCTTLPNPDSPGLGVFVLRRLAAMARASDVEIVQPVAYCPGLRPMPAWARTPARQIEGMTIHHRPMFYVPGALKSLDSRWLARSILPRLRAARAQIDLVDAHFGYPDGVGCVMAARRIGLPVFVTIRGLEADRVRRPLIREQLIGALNAATGVVSVSHSLRALMIEHGAAGDRIAVIPNAVDRNTFRPLPREAARARLGLAAHDPIIVSVGHLISGKRHNVLIEAVAKLAGTGQRMTLAIVGGRSYEPEYPQQLANLVARLGLGSQVRFVGAIPPAQVADWLAAANVFALGTMREGCCNAVLEALACGRPVVTTPVGDNPHFVKEGVNGHLVPVDDADATAAALRAAFARDWDTESISRTLDVGTWDDVARRTLEFFSERLGVARSAAA